MFGAALSPISMSGSCSARLMVSRASQVGPKTERIWVGPVETCQAVLAIVE